MNEPTSTLTQLTPPSRDDITRKARELWESYGRPAGRDDEIWLEAERLLQSSAAPASPQSAPVAATETAPATPPGSTPATAPRAAARGSARAMPRTARKS